MTLNELIQRHGADAIVAVIPVAMDVDETEFRWDVLIDGKDDAGVDVRLRIEGDVRVLLLVAGDDEVELHAWNPTTRYAAIREPTAIRRTLRDLAGALE